ncbi:SusC/RagA family TonB-linked outer membrane protein [Spirosoma spitsbergense]|uniref:SusC/RagA family TonB-linked outer membrane protein n=1 Tax=Spirosoma spitsbergense TaxID=431554 RepID=UPI000476CCEA|nr:TonB-dependent receptor [Spirosoma spitsbergense]
MKRSCMQVLLAVTFTGISLAHDAPTQELLDKRVNLRFENQHLRIVLKEIENQAAIRFAFRPREIPSEQKLTLIATDESLGEVLEKIVRPLRLRYEVVGRQIILSPLKPAPQSETNTSRTEKAQASVSNLDQTVSGTVRDESGAGLPGVSVILKGTPKGTTSDADGNFRLTLPDGNAILTFSFVGYVSQDVSVGGRSQIDVSLVADNKSLDEVVVIGYGTQKKVNLTGSVASLDQKFLANRPITNSTQALQGLTGVYVNMTGGRPGADAATIRIRGVGSFGTGNDPLVLVDGIEFPLTSVNPADIESITVLKDAASAAIYGNRAANGVVLVKTRNGSKGKLQVDYNNYVGFQQATVVPDVVTNAVDYMEGKNRALINQGSPIEYNQALIDEYKAGTDPYIYANSNWFDIMLRKAPQQEHNLRFSGGNDKTQFSLSLGYLNQEGILQNTWGKRYSVNSNITSDINKWLRVGGSIVATYWNYRESAYTSNDGNGEGGIMGLLYRGLPMQVPLLADGSYADQWIRVPGHNFYRNPYALSYEGFHKNSTFQTIFNLFAEVKLAPGLTYKVTAAPNLLYSTERFNNPQINLVQPKTGAIAPMGNIPPRSVTQGAGEDLRFTNFHTLTLNRTFATRHELSALLGFSLEMFNNGSFQAGNQGYIGNDIYELNAGSSNPAVSGNTTQSRLQSYFGRANYVFDSRYLFEVNFRYDGSSRFAADKRWGFFPSVSGGWRINEEPFLKDVRALSNLKLRASWGKLGSQPQQLFGFVSAVNSGINYNFNNSVVGGTAVTQIAEQNLTWESTTITDVGLEVGVLNNRLTGEIDYFNKITDGILRQVNIPQQVGNLTGPVRNVGKVQNKGVEFTLNWRDKIGQVGYNFGGNLTVVKNEVLNTDGQQIFNGNRVIFEGSPIDSYYGRVANGYFQTADEIKAAPFQNAVTLPGDIKYKDLNGDGKIDNNDRQVIGNVIPKQTYNFTLGATYKNFDFTAFFQGVQGVDNFINLNLGFPYRNGAGVTKDWLTDSWTPENPNAKYPRLTTANGYPQNFQISDFWLRDASYLRLKNIQIGYLFPAALTSRLGISKLRLFANAQNFLTFTKFNIGDPERSATSEGIIQYPIAKVATAGLNVTF